MYGGFRGVWAETWTLHLPLGGAFDGRLMGWSWAQLLSKHVATACLVACFLCVLFCLPLFFLLGLHLRRMEVPLLGVKWGAAAYATATPDPSHFLDLCRGWIINPLIEVGGEPVSSQTWCRVLHLLSHTGNSRQPVSLPHRIN